MPEQSRTMSFRLDEALAEHVAQVAAVEGKAVSEVVRAAIAEHVEARMRDPEFVLLLEENLARYGRLLDQLRRKR
jgi:predicted transcriptional regulator